MVHIVIDLEMNPVSKEYKEVRRHTALADAENTAYLLPLMQDSVTFRRQMQPVLDLFKDEECSTSIGELCPQLLAFACA